MYNPESETMMAAAYYKMMEHTELLNFAIAMTRSVKFCQYRGTLFIKAGKL
jgi:hypothetical protein